MLNIYIYNVYNFVIQFYIYNKNYTYTHITELYQQAFIYNEEAQCTSHASCCQLLELPQSHFGDDWEGILFIAYCIYIYKYTNVYMYI